MDRQPVAFPMRVVIVILVATLAFAACLQQQNTFNGRPLVAGMQLCEGVPAQMCQEQVASMRTNGNAPLVGFRITCTSATGCTRESGDAEIGALYADGTIQGGGFGWSQAVPAQ